MTYNKPEVVVLSDAVSAIQGPPKSGTLQDGQGVINSAYELDEE